MNLFLSVVLRTSAFTAMFWDNFLQSIRTRDSVSFVSRVSASLWTFTSSIKCVQALREIFPFVYFPDLNLNLNLYCNRVKPPPKKCLVFPTANEEEQTGSSIGKYVPLTSPSGFHPYSYSCIFLHCQTQRKPAEDVVHPLYLIFYSSHVWSGEDLSRPLSVDSRCVIRCSGWILP